MDLEHINTILKLNENPTLHDIPANITSSTLLSTYHNIARTLRNAISNKDFDSIYDQDLLKELMQSDTFIVHAASASATRAKAKRSPRPHKKVNDTKIKQKVISNMLNEYPFNLFNFKNREECKSSSRSKPYYINKNDLVNIISNNPELSQVFPKGYKKLPKEAICDTLFDITKT